MFIKTHIKLNFNSIFCLHWLSIFTNLEFSSFIITKGLHRLLPQLVDGITLIFTTMILSKKPENFAPYKNIADLYTKYRPTYPIEFFDFLGDLSFSKERFLDLGCGTGEVLILLSSKFKKAYGIEPDASMIALAKQEAEKKSNIHFIQDTAEEFLKSYKEEPFSLITASRSIHWMDAKYVISKSYENLSHKGVFAICGDTGSIWKTNEPCLSLARDMIFDYQKQNNKTFNPVQGHSLDFQDILDELIASPFPSYEKILFEKNSVLNAEKILGLYFSATGVLNLLGNDKNAFINEFNNKFMTCYPDGNVKIKNTFALTYCIKD